MSKVLVKSAWGSDGPTKAVFPFLHANTLAGSAIQVMLCIERLTQTHG